MAKKKTKSPLTSCWVRYSPPVGMPAGPARLGPFLNHKGVPQRITLQDGVWTEVNGTWAENLKAHPCGESCEFSDTKPKDAN